MKTTHGGAGRNQGRKPGSPPGPGRTPQSVKALAPICAAIKAAAARFDPPGQPVAEIPGLTYCLGCGRWGWEQWSITVGGEDWGVAPSTTPLSTEVIAGQIVRHSKNCRYR